MCPCTKHVCKTRVMTMNLQHRPTNDNKLCACAQLWWQQPFCPLQLLRLGDASGYMHGQLPLLMTMHVVTHFAKPSVWKPPARDKSRCSRMACLW